MARAMSLASYPCAGMDARGEEDEEGGFGGGSGVDDGSRVEGGGFVGYHDNRILLCWHKDPSCVLTASMAETERSQFRFRYTCSPLLSSSFPFLHFFTLCWLGCARAERKPSSRHRRSEISTLSHSPNTGHFSTPHFNTVNSSNNTTANMRNFFGRNPIRIGDYSRP